MVSKKTLITGVGIVLLILSGVLQLLGFDNFSGLGTFGLAILALIILRDQQNVTKRLRDLRSDLKDNVELSRGVRNIISWYGKQLLDYGSSTLKRVRIIGTDLHRGHKQSEEPLSRDTPVMGTNVGKNVATKTPPRAGRVATPDVTNPNATESLANLLDPEHKVVVGGVFDSSLVEGLPVETQVWRPSQILNLLEKALPDYVIIDEAVLERTYWQGVFTAAGTSQMSELLSAVDYCGKRKIPVYLLKTQSSPQVNSRALRSSTAVELPLKAQDTEQSFGAAFTPVLERANRTAVTREAK